MMRWVYALTWLLAAPLVLVRLAWRSRKQPGYLENVGERFGFYRREVQGPFVWVHAVSVGETRAAAPLVEALRARYPGRTILVTHMTPTGLAAGREIFGDSVERAWLPYDLGFAVRRFLRHFHPERGVLLETEIWPRLIAESKETGIPVVLANARLSERSARRYARVPSLARWALENLAGVAAQSREDAERLAALGARDPVALGNVKFDLAIPEAMIERGREFRSRIGSRPVWVAASTREGEEALLLDAFVASGAPPEVLLVIVPRHPQRFDEVARLASARSLGLARRSDEREIGPDARVLLGDSMGEMLAYYAAADVAIIGGSFLPFGGQNLIEACAVGKPVIVGPHTYNFDEAARGAIKAGAAVRVTDASGAMREALRITNDAALRDSMGAKGLDFVAAHRGAVDRIADWIAAKTKR
jgi:3-deoxy-D-manno-octulosonic-acid transferase